MWLTVADVGTCVYIIPQRPRIPVDNPREPPFRLSTHVNCLHPDISCPPVIAFYTQLEHPASEIPDWQLCQGQHATQSDRQNGETDHMLQDKKMISLVMFSDFTDQILPELKTDDIICIFGDNMLKINKAAKIGHYPQLISDNIFAKFGRKKSSQSFTCHIFVNMLHQSNKPTIISTLDISRQQTYSQDLFCNLLFPEK